MGVDAQAQYAQAVVEIVFPDRPVPCRRWSLEDLRTPDVIDQDVDGAMVAADPVGQRPHLAGFEVIEDNRDAVTTEFADKFGGLLDGLRSVIVGCAVARHAATTAADDGGAPRAPRRRA